MADNTLQGNDLIIETSQSRFGRKLLQTNSSSSLDTSQSAFIALLTIVILLAIAIVITTIILCYRCYSHREQKSKHHRKRQRVLPTRNNQQSHNPISVTPTSASSYSGRSTEELLSDQRHQSLSINTLPSRRLQQSMLDAYLNDIHSFQPANLDVKRLNSYLFVDLHSTSSDTFPDNVSKQFTNNTKTSGYYTSTEDESQRKSNYYYLKNQQRRRSSKLKQPYDPRFVMRERSLPNNLPSLPQLRQIVTQQQRHLLGIDDTNNSSTTIVNQDLQSTTMTTTTDDYDDSHAYNVKQNQILQTIKEEKQSLGQQYFPRSPFHYEQEPYLFEIVSTSRDDSSELHIPYISSPTIDHRIAYINDSIIV